MLIEKSFSIARGCRCPAPRAGRVNPIAGSGAVFGVALPAEVGLHELVPGIADGLPGGLVERGRPSTGAAASGPSARRRSTSHCRVVARFCVFLVYTAHNHEVARGAGNAVEGLDPAEHVERLPPLARVPEIEGGGVKVGEHRGGTVARETQPHLVDHGTDAVS